MRWGLNVLDWRSHAINEVGEHPIGVLKAECEHLLMMITTLHEKPSGVPRKACVTLRFDHAMAEVPGQIHPPRSGDDETDAQAWITYVSDYGHRRVMSNPAISDHDPIATRRPAPSYGSFPPHPTVTDDHHPHPPARDHPRTDHPDAEGHAHHLAAAPDATLRTDTRVAR